MKHQYFKPGSKAVVISDDPGFGWKPGTKVTILEDDITPYCRDEKGRTRAMMDSELQVLPESKFSIFVFSAVARVRGWLRATWTTLGKVMRR